MTPAEVQAEIDLNAEKNGDLTVPVEVLHPRGDNPRRNDRAAEKLTETILSIGWGAPILMQGDSGAIIGGHTRLKAAKSIGLERLPVRVLDVDDRRAKALALADNRMGELADWDIEGLVSELEGFSIDEAEAMGFDADYQKGLHPWDSDIDAIDKVKENLDGIPGRIVITCDEILKDEILECLTTFKRERGYEFTVV